MTEWKELPRERLVVAAALSVAASLSPDGLDRLVRRGFREYMRVAKPIYSGWSFSHDEYSTMFQLLRQRAAEQQRHG